MNTGFILPVPVLRSVALLRDRAAHGQLPTFVVLPDARGRPYNQKGNFGAGFFRSRTRAHPQRERKPADSRSRTVAQKKTQVRFAEAEKGTR